MSTEPIWRPSAERVQNANMQRFIAYANEHIGDTDISDYASLYAFSIDQPAAFWPLIRDFCGVQAGGSPEPVIANADDMPQARFYPNTQLNFAENLLRYRDDETAIVFRNEWGHQRNFTYAELAAEVARMAQGLRRAGVGRDDRVAAFLPNMPETIITMLAASSLGAVFSSCSPDFGINGVVDRFGQIEPKVLVTADAYPYNGKQHDCLEKVRGVLDAIPAIETLVVVPYASAEPDLSGLRNAVTWRQFAGSDDAELTFAQTDFNHPLYIMYSSGTTGAPKCIVHGAGGTLLQHLKELVLHTDLKRSDRIFYFTTCGWMMWNWLVSSLAVGATVVLYDGAPAWPDANALWDLADDVDISILGASAGWLSACEKAGAKPGETHRLDRLKAILSTGSPLKPESFDYVYRDVKSDVQLASISGGTDIVSCFALGNPVWPVYRGELQCRGLGLAVEALDDAGNPLRNEPGELSCLKPFPAMPVKFWNDSDGQRYHDAYFAKQTGIWSHGDFVEITDHDGVIILGRSDATLNPGGVRIGSAEIYRQVELLPEVLESVAVGQRQGEDERVVLFVRLRDGVSLDDALRDRIKKQLRANASPRHVPAVMLQVDDIPRTISGKISEIAVRKTIHGDAVKNTDALANPEALQQYSALRAEL